MRHLTAEKLIRPAVLFLAILATGLPVALQAQADSEPPANRKGTFFTLGLGYGSVSCDDCSSTGGVAPMFEVGGWLSPTVQLGFGARAWIGGGAVLGTGGAVLTAYFGKTSPVYVSALAGVAGEVIEDAAGGGFGSSVMLGVELPVSGSAVVAPYVGFEFWRIGESFTGITAGVALRLP